MIRLLKIELNKLRSFRAFWILTGMYFVALAGTLLSIQGVFNTLLDNNVPNVMQAGLRWDFYSLPDGWHYMTWVSSLFNWLLPTIVIILVCAEFNYKTARQNIINGMGRAEWMAGKLVLMGFFALASTTMVVLCTVFMGMINSDLSKGLDLFLQTGYVLGYFVQTTGYLILAMLLSIIIRHTGITIGIMTIYSLFLELVVEQISIHQFGMPKSWTVAFPLRAFSNLVMNPFSELTSGPLPVIDPTSWIVSLLYIGLFAGIGFWILKKRDL